MELSVDINGFGRCLDTLSQCERVLEQVRSTVRSQRNSMSSRILRSSGIDAQLQEVISRLRDGKSSVGRMKSALSSIERQYRSMEGNIEKLVGRATIPGGSTIGAQVIDNNHNYAADSTNRSDIRFDYSFNDFIKSFGPFGELIGNIGEAFDEKTWLRGVIKGGVGLIGPMAKIIKNINGYSQIGRAIGTNNATANFWRGLLGLNKVGHASTAKSPTARFYNNLNNTTSSFNLKKAFGVFVGKDGALDAVAAWAGVALTGVTNAFSNIDEQKASNGTMSTGRVVAETVTETVIDTVVTTAATAAVGAAITAATGVVAAPVLVAAATGLLLAGVNTGVEALTGKTATEWVSDAVIDTACKVGNAVKDGAKAVAGWFKKLFD